MNLLLAVRFAFRCDLPSYYKLTNIPIRWQPTLGASAERRKANLAQNAHVRAAPSFFLYAGAVVIASYQISSCKELMQNRIRVLATILLSRPSLVNSNHLKSTAILNKRTNSLVRSPGSSNLFPLFVAHKRAWSFKTNLTRHMQRFITHCQFAFFHYLSLLAVSSAFQISSLIVFFFFCE